MPRKPDVPCSVCGVLLYGGKGSLPAGERTCRPCRTARKPKGRPRESRACPVCGTQTMRPMFCSDKCATKDKGQRRAAGLTGLRPRNCEVCSAEYRPSYPAQRTCGRACGWELRLKEGTAHAAIPLEPVQLVLPDPRACAQCSHPFIGLRGSYCSRACAREAQRAYARAYFLQHYKPKQAPVCRRCGRRRTDSARHPFCTPCVSTAKRKRKRRERRRIKNLIRNVVSESYTLDEIAQRDRFTCQLCRKRVAMKQVVPHPKAPTIDHVVPRADGGNDTRANVQLAHFRCNCLKSSRGMQQLALIG